ncbi:MAG: ribosomal protein L11 methyltransferase [Porticoccaceae bacterium]|nr:MAG: ribosomal protein L11 methyltransferase [Porticoccaceae bacterium]
MPWLRLSFQVGREEVARWEEALEAAGACAVSLLAGEPAEEPVLEPGVGEAPLWRKVTLAALFPADADRGELRARLALDERPHRFEWLEDRAWERVWLDRFGPIRCGRRLWVLPDGREAPEPAAVAMRLDPGLAFGTGDHPTTRLCLEWLDRHPPEGLQVVDYGCGSGILAIAALLLGARRALGVDHDPQALWASRANAARNGLGEDRLVLAAPQALPALRAELVLANILAAPLIDLAERLTDLLLPEGWLVLSGFTPAQADAVARAFPRVAFRRLEVRDGWAMLAGQRCG